MLPRTNRDRVAAELAAFGDRVAFGPGTIEIQVIAESGGTEAVFSVVAVIELQGGRAWSVKSIVER